MLFSRVSAEYENSGELENKFRECGKSQEVHTKEVIDRGIRRLPRIKNCESLLEVQLIVQA